MSIAVRRRRSAAWPFVISGRAARSHATVPATIGAAKLVPDATVTPSAAPSVVSSATGMATGTSSPGAATSIEALALEKYDDSLSCPVDATDRTCGHAAG